MSGAAGHQPGPGGAKILSSVALKRETLNQKKQVDSVKNTFGSHNAVRKTEGRYFSEHKPRKDL